MLQLRHSEYDLHNSSRSCWFGRNPSFRQSNSGTGFPADEYSLNYPKSQPTLNNLQEFLLLEEKEAETESEPLACDVGSVTLDSFTARCAELYYYITFDSS